MPDVDRRLHEDRRRVPRGGRRAYDRPGAYPTILVADGYEGARRPVARYLQRFHFDVLEASDGEEALQKIVAASPHVILAEWSLPFMPARRLCQWLDQSWRTRSVPVIVLVGDYEPGAGMPPVAGILIKPFSLAVMLDEIRRVIRSQQQHAA
jgi:DNA-binding response OmpR family regulator